MVGRGQRVGGIVFALAVGMAVAVYGYLRVTDPQPRIERQREEAIVQQASDALRVALGARNDLQIVDPLNPNRVAGKTYVYPDGGGWEVSGYYRHGDDGLWNPWLMRLDQDGSLVQVTVRDASGEIDELASENPRLTVTE